MCKFSQLWKSCFRSQAIAFPLISMCEAAGLQQMKHILTGVPAFNNKPFHPQIKMLGRTRRPRRLSWYHRRRTAACLPDKTPSCWSYTQQRDGDGLKHAAVEHFWGLHLQSGGGWVDPVIDPNVDIGIRLILDEMGLMRTFVGELTRPPPSREVWCSAAQVGELIFLCRTDFFK